MRVDNFLGFGMSGFRSYGGEMQYAGPMERVHLIAGKNNSGKSNLIKYLMRVLGESSMGLRLSPPPGGPNLRDVPEGWEKDAAQGIALCFSESYVREKLIERADVFGAAMESLFKTAPFRRGSDAVVWLQYRLEWQHYEDYWEITPDRAQIHQGLQELRDSDGVGESDFGNHLEATILQKINNSDVWSGLPPVEWIEAKREIGAQDSFKINDTERAGWQNGRGFIPLLAKLQSPETIDYSRDRPKFEALQAFVRSVLEDEDALISIPGSEVELQVTTRGRLEPHTFLGTGLAEVVHIAAVATAHSDTLIAIEEPEVHLHPGLQKQLVRYLEANTSNRYVITTHSASLLDFSLASISQVSLDDDRRSVVRPVMLRKEYSELVLELGNRPSELVQANFLIWVEGPADRIYVSLWLRLIDPSIVEGIHYSIMFYGGALLNHLTAQDDPEVNGFIQLAFIARSFAVIIDSDRKDEGDKLNATKMRVIGEVEARGGMAWVTAGYTIENYLSEGVLEAAIARAYPERTYKLPSGKWISPLGRTFNGSETQPNKVTVARAVLEAENTVTEFLMDLKPRLLDLTNRIRDANGLLCEPSGPGAIDG